MSFKIVGVIEGKIKAYLNNNKKWYTTYFEGSDFEKVPSWVREPRGMAIALLNKEKSKNKNRKKTIKNPSDALIGKYVEFHGKKPNKVLTKMTKKKIVGMSVGKLTCVGYNKNKKNYLHEFSKSSQPTLVVDTKGKLFITGGKYGFDASRGIIDL